MKDPDTAAQILEELRRPIQKSACLATIGRATAYLAGLGQTTGHRRRKAIANHFSSQFCWVAVTRMSDNVMCLFVPSRKG